MKRNLIALLLVFIVFAISLASCNVNNGDDDKKNDGNSDVDGGVQNGESSSQGIIFSPEKSVTVIKGAGDGALDLLGIVDRIYELTSKVALINTDASPDADAEIVIGNTTRGITSTALSKLEAKIAAYIRDAEDNNETYEDLVGYAIYSDGKNVALVWTEDEICDMAIDAFIEKFLVSPTLTLADGYFYSEEFSLLEYKRSLEEAEREELFAKIEAELGVAAASALKNYYSMFDERYYLWMANLYDPGEYDEEGNPLGGGFYFSNSGRDTPGYGIDLESTSQALSLLGSSGMLVDYDDDLSKAIPEKMQREIVAFVLSCQSPEDGYFYHPQWESVTTSRRGRDLDWATGLLEKFGAVPYYDTPSGVDGLFGAPGVSAVSHMTGRLGDSGVMAVSKVISTASTLPRELQSLDNFKTYLSSFTNSMNGNSYSIGNTLGAISSQIVDRGEDYIKAFEEWANDLQFESTGIWEDKIHYNSVNGLMKLSGTYNSLGLKINHADKALEAALEMVLHEGKDVKNKEATNSVDVWNPFCAITNLLTNIEKYGDPAVADSFLAKARENALDIIIITSAKNSQFKKDDGSFGYSNGGVGALSQGAPVAVGGTYEGDINGGNIAVTGVSNYMCRVLGIDVVPIYYPTDLEVYLKTINGLGPVLKEDVVLDSESIHFDEEDVGQKKPSGVNTHEGLGSIFVTEDPREGADGNVLSFTTEAGNYSAISATPAASKGSSCYVLDFEICIQPTAFTGTAFQIKMGKSYMLTLNISGGKVEIGDSSNTDGSQAVANKFGVFFGTGEWANIRVEYYPADEEEGVRVKIYLNDTLVVISDNYTGQPKSGVGDPVRDYGNVEFYALNATYFTVLFDNIEVKKIAQEFSLDDGSAIVKWFITNSEYENVFGTIGTGEHAQNSKTESYTSADYAGLVGDSATSSVIKEGENGILRLEKTGEGSALAKFFRGKMLGSVYVAETDIKWLSPKDATEDTYFKLLLAPYAYVGDGLAMLEMIGVGDGYGGVSLTLDGASEPFVTLNNNRWYNLRIELTPRYKDGVALSVSIYLDNVKVFSDTVAVSDESLISDYIGFAIELSDGVSGFKLDLDNTYKGVALSTAHPDVEYSYASPALFDGGLGDEYVTHRATSASTVDAVLLHTDDPTGAVNKVIKAYFPKASENEYAVSTVIGNSSDEKGADAVYSSFSTDVYFDPNGSTGTGRTARLIFKHGAEKKYTFGIDLHVEYDSSKKTYSLKVAQYNRKVDATDGEGPGTGMVDLFKGVPVIGEWFNLRIDFCKSDTASVVSVYINDVCYAENVLCYYAVDNFKSEGSITEVEWRYIRSDVTTYLDNPVLETRVANAALDWGTDIDPTAPTEYAILGDE